jgi:hypothetical protein
MLKEAIYIALVMTSPLAIFAEDRAEQKAKTQEYFSTYSGSGHGGSLDLMQFQKNSDTTYSVLSIYINTGSMMNRIKPRSKWPYDAYKLTMKKALVDENTYTEAKKICVAGLDNSQDISEGDGSFASVDFISGLRFVDEKETREKIYCGYVNSARTPFYKPLSKATRELSDLSANFKWQEQDDPELTGFITDTLILLYPKFKDSYWWWPKERLIQMSGRKGNTQAIPLLIKLMKETQEGVYSDTKSVNDRNLEYIVTALDDITGQGLRFDEKGEPRHLTDVVKDYLAKYIP